MSQVTPLTRWAFSAGGLSSTGIVSNGIDYFLLFFYSQIIGLSPALTGIALAIALGFDAVSDPLIGYVSDNWRSKLGRRHPFMYASIIPMTVLYVIIWFPPVGASQAVLFSFLLVIIVLLRLSMTLFDVPFWGLLAELTTDYDERTQLSSRYIAASWIVSSIMSIAMYSYWLSDSPVYPNGELNMAGYQEAAVVGAVIILMSLVFSVGGMHPEIPNLRKRTKGVPRGLGPFFASISRLLRNPSLRALLLSGIVRNAGWGTTAALWIYQHSAFYGLNSDQMSVLIFVQLAAILILVPVVKAVTGRGEKKRTTIVLLAITALVSLLVPSLMIVGVLPERGSRELVGVLMVNDFLRLLVYQVAVAFIYSLFADVTEDIELQTNERMESAIFAASTFIQKSSIGLGALIAGLLLAAIDFPTMEDGVEVQETTLNMLGLGYGGVWAVCVAISIWLISGYRITRASHNAEVETLEIRNPTDLPD